jgi:hypothetical protein
MSSEAADAKAKKPEAADASAKKPEAAQADKAPPPDPSHLWQMAANMAAHEQKGHTGAALFAVGGVVVLIGALWAVISSASGGGALSYGPLMLLGVGGAVMSVTGLTRMREGEVASHLRAALVTTAEAAERMARKAAEAKKAKAEGKPRLAGSGRPRPKPKKKGHDEDDEVINQGPIHLALAHDQMLIKSYHLRELHKSLRARVSEAEAALEPDEHVSYVLMAETIKMQAQVLVLTGMRLAIINENRVEWHYLKDVKNPLARWQSNSPQCEFSVMIDGKPYEWANVEPEAAAFHAAKLIDVGVFPLPARHIPAHPSPITVRAPGKYVFGTLTSPSSGSTVPVMSTVEVVLTANNVVHIVCSGEDLIALPASDSGLRFDNEAIVTSELKDGPLASTIAAKTLLGPMRLRGMPREESDSGKPHLVLMVHVDELVGLVLMTDETGTDRIMAATKLPPPVEPVPVDGASADENAAASVMADNGDVGAVAAAIMAAVAAENPVTDEAVPSVQPDVPASGDPSAVIRELERVHKLHVDGVLTDDELRNLTRRLVSEEEPV